MEFSVARTQMAFYGIESLSRKSSLSIVELVAARGVANSGNRCYQPEHLIKRRCIR